MRIAREFSTFNSYSRIKVASSILAFILSLITIMSLTTLSIQLPSKIGRLNDYANVLRVGDHADLEMKLDELSSRGKELTILVSRNDPYRNPDRFGFEISRKWGIYKSPDESLIVIVHENGGWRVSLSLSPSITGIFPDEGTYREFQNQIRDLVKEGNIRKAVLTSVNRFYNLLFNPDSETDVDKDPGGGGIILYFIIGGVGLFVLLTTLIVREARLRCPKCGSRMEVHSSGVYGREKYCPRCGYHEQG